MDTEDFLKNNEEILKRKLRTLKTLNQGAVEIGVPITPEEEESAKKLLRQCYEDIMLQYDKYLDWELDEIKLQAIWVIGTYFYKEFASYPYKFITAMKGSGKSRLLRLTEELVDNGKMVAGISDSALFRMACNHTLLFDEAEQIGKKEKQTMREILNAGYKQGGKIIRVKEKHGKDGKEFENQEFDVYSPKMLANIFGMDNVLGDRCITSILERSNNPAKTKLQEDFKTNENIKKIKEMLLKVRLILIWCTLWMNVHKNKCTWNDYILHKYHSLYTYTTQHTLSSPTTLNCINEDLLNIYNKIDDIDLDGRQLELYFPLFIIGNMIGEDVLEEVLKIAKKKNETKKENDYMENKDISLYDFVSNLNYFQNYVSLKELSNQFKLFIESDDEGLVWLNPTWMGRALARLKLVIQRRRIGREGTEVMLNIPKAKEKIKMFKIKEEDSK